MPKAKRLNTEKIRTYFKYTPESGWITPASTHPRLFTQPNRRLGCIHKKHKYRLIRMGGGVSLRTGRVAWLLMTGEDPGDMLIDHKDGDRGNDIWINLRLATYQQNSSNLGATKGRKLPKGVYYEPYRDSKNKSKPRRKPYRARIWVSGKARPLGWYKTIGEAEAARKAGEAKHFGDFARQSSAL